MFVGGTAEAYFVNIISYAEVIEVLCLKAGVQ